MNMPSTPPAAAAHTVGVQAGELERYLDDLLQSARFRDYCPNGLQVEGVRPVRRLVSGVTASLALIDAAIARGADALLVHHGYFWRGEDSRLRGMRRERIARLLGNGLALLAYHLPLDAHAQLGNNAQLALQLGFSTTGTAGENGIIAWGDIECPTPQAPGSVGEAPSMVLADLARRVEVRLGRPALVLGNPERVVRRIAWCTGGAQGFFETAIDLGVDVFLTGEVSEQNHHLAMESGVGFIAAGHHATERYGVRAVGEHLAQQFGLCHEFVDIPNPV